MSGTKRKLMVLLLALCSSVSFLFATVETNVTQPIGTLVRTYEPNGAILNPPFSGDLPQPPVPPDPLPVGVTPFSNPTNAAQEVNYICAQWDNGVRVDTIPFDENYPTTEVILTQQQHFVRLLGTPTSSANGAWIMRSQYVRGKTVAELTDIFALKNAPIAICDVDMPASPDPVTGKNYVLWTGIAAPILGGDHNWGNGGSVQNRLVSDYGTNYFPTYRYTDSSTRSHTQPIGDYALSYRPMAGCGNTYCVAAYLDTYIPEAYSDLENVYHDLDYLNYVGFGTAPLRCALHQLSPERYDAVSFLAFRNALLAGESLLEWQVHQQWANRWIPCSHENKRHKYEPNFWLSSISEFTTRAPVSYCDNFHANTSGAIACLDWPIRHNIDLGITAAGLGNRINWLDCTWKAKSGSGEFGLYVNYFREKFFINGILSGGGNWGDACRAINFYGVARTAYSHPKNATFSAQLQGGIIAWKSIVPSARLSYFFNRQKCFNECGADSLNLYLPNYTTHTLHARIGFDINHVFEKPQVKIVPQVQVAWAGDFFLRHHVVKAQICGPTSCLCVCGLQQPGGYFVGGFDINLIFKNCYALLARYEAQANSNFIAQGVKVGLQVNF